MHHKIYVSASGVQYWEGSSTTSTKIDALEPFMGDLPPGPITLAADIPLGQGAVAMPTAIDQLRPKAANFESRSDVMIWPALTFRDPAVIVPNPTPLAGFMRLIPNFDGVVCLVTDKTYWIRVSAGEACHALCDPTRKLTGALGPVTDPDSFRAAFDETNGRSSRLGAELAQLEAKLQFEEISTQDFECRRLGLAIGAEFATAKPYWLGEQVTVIADHPMAEPYTLALNHMGCSASELPLHQAVFAGLSIGMEL